MIETIERIYTLVLFADLGLLGALIYLVVELSNKHRSDNQERK